MNILFSLLYFFIFIIFVQSKSSNSGDDSSNSLNNQIDFNKKYIIVFKDVIDDTNDENRLNKRMDFHNNLKSKYNLLTIKYPLYDTPNSDDDKILRRRNDLDYSSFTQNKNFSDKKSPPVLLKSFMFINENDMIREIYGNNKDINLLKRSEKKREFTINEFIKSVNSSEIPIDYIEEDYPVYSDDISNEEYQHFLNYEKRSSMNKSFVLNNLNETLEEDVIYGENIEIQKNYLEWVNKT